MRVPVDLYQRLEALAHERNESVSQAARRLIGRGLEPVGRNAIDDAIATLMSVRDHHPSTDRTTRTADHEPSPAHRTAPKRIDVLNAKIDLQRLVTDVSHGDEFLITHAGAPRARLIAVDDHSSP